MTTDYEFLDVERHGRVTTVWLNRPEKFNALSVELMGEIEAGNHRGNQTGDAARLRRNTAFEIKP